MWFGLINEIKYWFIRTFITRNCWMPKGDVTFSWADEERIMSTQIQPTPIVTGEKAKEIETYLNKEYCQEDINKSIEKLKQEYNPYEHWVPCLECIYIEECENKEDRDGCLAGEKYEDETN